MRIKARPSSKLQNLIKDEEGLTTVEYAIILTLVVIISFVLWKNIGQSVADGVETSEENMDDLSNVEVRSGG